MKKKDKEFEKAVDTIITREMRYKNTVRNICRAFQIHDDEAKFCILVAYGASDIDAVKQSGYYSKQPPQVTAARLRGNPLLYKVINFVRDSRIDYIMLTEKRLIQQLMDIATADVNEFVSVRKGCCRFCWGKGHKYQWIDPNEFDNAEDVEWVRRGRPTDGELDFHERSGGFGYVASAVPNPDCPRCVGEGVPYVFLGDTRELSPGARLLYEGAVVKKTGIEVNTGKRDYAIKHLMDYFNRAKTDDLRIRETEAKIEESKLRAEILRKQIEIINSEDTEDGPVIVHNSLSIPEIGTQKVALADNMVDKELK